MQIPEVLKGVDVARALKDEAYRSTLSAEQQQALAAFNEQSELSDEDLDQVAGGGGGTTVDCRNTYLCRPPDTQ
jgi:mersacidin/lichenicidin family type 2 lantibiotic